MSRKIFHKTSQTSKKKCYNSTLKENLLFHENFNTFQYVTNSTLRKKISWNHKVTKIFEPLRKRHWLDCTLNLLSTILGEKLLFTTLFLNTKDQNISKDLQSWNCILLLKRQKTLFAMETKSAKSQQHPVFPGGHPSKYWLGSVLLHFIVFHLIWVIGTYGNWKNQNPWGRFGATS